MAAIAYAVQNILERRANGGATVLAPTSAAPLPPTTMAGRKCPECGAHAVIRKDGCEYCTACGHIGACG